MQIWQSVGASRRITIRRSVAAMAALALACVIVPPATLAQNAYITNESAGTVSVIDTTTDTVIGDPILVGRVPYGVAVTPDGSKVYVTNGAGTVSVIDTATNAVSTITDPSFDAPIAFGLFIQPAKKFAGMPGQPSCSRVSVVALVSQYGELDDAAKALNYAGVRALRHAIRTFCGG